MSEGNTVTGDPDGAGVERESELVDASSAAPAGTTQEHDAVLGHNSGDDGPNVNVSPASLPHHMPSFKDQARDRAADAPGVVSAQDGPAKAGPSFNDQVQNRAAFDPGARAAFAPGAVSPAGNGPAKAGPSFKDQVRNTEAAHRQVGTETTGPRFKDQVNNVQAAAPNQVINAQAAAPDNQQNQHAEDTSAIEEPEPVDSTLLLEAQVVEDQQDQVMGVQPDMSVYAAEPLESGILLNRKKAIILLLTMLLILGVVVGGVCGSGNCSSKTTAVAIVESSPTNEARAASILGYLNEISWSDTEIRSDPQESSQERAANWLIQNDPLELTVDTAEKRSRLVQRFALLTLWFETSGTWTNSSGWLSAEDECDWFGIDCVFGSVTAIDMFSNNIRANKLSDTSNC